MTTESPPFDHEHERPFDELPPTAQLNVLGESVNPLEETSAATERLLSAVCVKVAQERGHLISRFNEQTPMTEDQACAYALGDCGHEQSPPVSMEGIALFLTWNNGTECDPDSAQSRLDEAEAVTDWARATVGALCFPDREEHLDKPALMHLEESTAEELGRRADREGKFVYEVVEELVEEAAKVDPLQEAIGDYIAETDPARVAVVTESEDFPNEAGDVLHLVSHVSFRKMDSPEAQRIRQLDRVEVLGTRYRVNLEESAMVIPESGHYSLYVSSAFADLEAVPLLAGIAGLRDKLPLKP